ncbi:MAG: hypothetical protein V4480_00535 [Patescibacteria group bacterium]
MNLISASVRRGLVHALSIGTITTALIFLVSPALALASPPTCTLTATPSTVDVGDHVTLNWASTGATYGTWLQDAAAAVLGLSGDALLASGSEDFLVGSTTGTITPTLQVAQTAKTLTQVASTSLPAFTNAIGLEIVGNYAYVVDAGASHQLDVISIANPTAPAVVGTTSSLTNLNGAFYIKISGNYAFVTATGSDRLTVVDISNPTAPAVVASLSDSRFSAPRGLFLVGNYAYVVGNSQGSLSIVDISNPLAPVIKGSLTDSTILSGGDSLFVDGRYAYVTAGQSSTLAVIDIASSTAPAIVGTLVDPIRMNNPKELLVSGNYAYVTALASNALVIVDISSSTAPTIVSALSDTTRLAGPKNLTIFDGIAYIAANSGRSLVMADITDPHAPFIIDSKRDTTNLSDPRGVAISGGYIFIASGNIFDVFTTVETSLASDCSATITVSGGTQQPTATVDSVLNSAGNATISGTATGPTSLTVIIYPSFDSDTVVYRDDQVPVSGGHWSVTAPLQSGSYTVEVHSSSQSPSAGTYLTSSTFSV